MAQLARGLTRTLSGTESNVSLKELHLVTGNTTTYPMDSPVASNSSLGAWYDEGQDERFVVYHTSDSNRLTEFNAIQRSTAAIMATNDARAKTSVAAVPFQGNVYLYYADSSDNLRRVTRANGQWGTSAMVRDSPPVGNGQITVTAANGLNHVLYLARDDSMAQRGLTHGDDRIGWPS